MDTQSPTFPLKIYLSLMSQNTRALLEYYFKNIGQPLFTQMETRQEADCVVIDYEHPLARQEVEDQARILKTPYIVLSFSSLDYPNVTVIGKPIAMQKLNIAAKHIVSIYHKIQNSRVKTNQIDPYQISVELPAMHTSNIPLLTNKVIPHEQVTTVLSEHIPIIRKIEINKELNPFRHRVNEKTVKLNGRDISTNNERAPTFNGELPKIQPWKNEILCGKNNQFILSFDGKNLRSTYDYSNFLCGHFNSALKSSSATNQAFSIDTLHIKIVVLPSEQKVCASRSVLGFNDIDNAFYQLNATDVTVEFNSYDEFAKQRKELETKSVYTYSLEAFNWLVTLRCANGRMPQDFDINQELRLKHWPNFTRIEETPYCMRIAAAWTLNFKTLAVIIQELEIEPRYVIAFYNGANSLELFEYNNLLLPKKRGFLDSFRTKFRRKQAIL